jgi:hypothetical protein
MSHSTPTSRLLALPWELRDEIYAYTLFEAEGYHHKPVTSKLRLVNGEAIDLALMYVCKQIAEKSTDLALEVNRLSFETYCQSESWSNNMCGPRGRSQEDSTSSG